MSCWAPPIKTAPTVIGILYAPIWLPLSWPSLAQPAVASPAPFTALILPLPERLAKECIYVEQGRSSKRGAQKRPLFERMKRDAAQRRFTRLLVWKVSRLGRDMREVISTVYELADLGVTIVPVKSQTGPVNTAMGRLLWAIQSWYGEMENEERSENVRLGQARARAQGKEIGRPREVGNEIEQQILALRAKGHGYKIIAQRTGVPRSTIRRILKGAESMPKTQSL